MPQEAALKSMAVKQKLRDRRFMHPRLQKNSTPENETTRRRVRNYLVVEQDLSLGQTTL